MQRSNRIGHDELTFLNRQLASMARLELPFPDGLRALAREVEGRDFRRLLEAVMADLEEGQTLSEALSRHGEVFSNLYLGIVQAGEESGDLAAALEGLANYSESMLFLRKRVKATLAYPTVALVLSVGMMFFIFTQLIPKFRDVFDALDINLPGITETYLDLATGFQEHSLLVVTGILTAIVIFWGLRRSASGDRMIRQLSLNLPFYGKLLRQVLLLRFCETLRALLRSNVSLVPALELTANTLGENVLRTTVLDMRDEAVEGRRMSEVLRRNSLFPKTFVWKFSLAEEQGNLEHTLDELCRYMEMELRTAAARFSSLFEPFLIVLIGLMVGSMVLSVFLPIFNLQASLAG